jgi:predicted RNA-binding protein
MQYWLVITSPDNFKFDRENLNFKLQGLPHRFRKQVQKMAVGDRVAYYIMKLQKFGATATITGDYFEESSKPSEPNIILNDDELIDAKKLVTDLTFIKRKERWGVFFQGSIKTIPEEDFKLIESEMKKTIAKRLEDKPIKTEIQREKVKIEADYEKEIMQLPLQSNSLHDRVGEMLEQIGSWMGYNAQTRHRIIPEHAYELDVAWLSGKNPEVAIEVQVSGNLTEAKDRLAQARKFNYRKVIIVLKERDIQRLNSLMKHEPDLRSWMEAWSIGAIYEMYNAGETFFKYYHRLKESIYKDKKELVLVN